MRVVHDERPRAAREGDQREVRHQAGPHDHGPPGEGGGSPKSRCARLVREVRRGGQYLPWNGVLSTQRDEQHHEALHIVEGFPNCQNSYVQYYTLVEHSSETPRATQPLACG